MLGILLTGLGGCTYAAAKHPIHSEPPPLQMLTKAPIPAADPTPVALRPGHPQTYTVIPGDTLWDIAGRFLESPWLWPQIWRQNPKIRNPHLIYPGDVIELYYEDGHPRLRLADTRPTIKLSPTIRYEGLDQAIPTLRRDLIQPFLDHSMVFSQAEWLAAPYIIGAADHRLAFAAADRIYARGNNFDQRYYRVFRMNKGYHDPISGKPLGFDAIFVGDAVLERNDDPATLLLLNSGREARVGDRLLPIDASSQAHHFTPHAPPIATQGQIIALLTGGTLIGQYQTVVLNLGEQDDLEVGHVLGVFQAGRHVRDPINRKGIFLPDERVGLLMVYKVFDAVSYGLVMNATRTIRVLDRVGAP